MRNQYLTSNESELRGLARGLWSIYWRLWLLSSFFVGAIFFGFLDRWWCALGCVGGFVTVVLIMRRFWPASDPGERSDVTVSDIHQLRIARWDRIQQRGPCRFALVQGVSMYGGLLWIAFAIAAWSRYTPQEWLRFVGIAAIGGAVGGFLFGILMYRFTMWTYHRYKKRFS